MKKLVALVGFKQSGKSTAAKYLESKYDFTRHNFKDSLVDEIKQNFPDLLGEIQSSETYLDESLCEFVGPTIDELFQTKPPLMRALMINYGTEVRRREQPGYWVHQWKLKVPDLYAQDKTSLVVDDCRFLDEAQAIKAWGGIIIRIVRTDITKAGTHLSETEQLNIPADYTIEVGPGEHEKLYVELDRIMAL